MNVFITGGTGLLANYLQGLAPAHAQITTCFLPSEEPLTAPLPFPGLAFDLTDFNTLSSVFSRLAPDLVIHTAAQGSVDWCEENQSSAKSINISASLKLLDLCHYYHAHFIFISSNAVYGGVKAYSSETDEPRPVNYYGASKLAVEQTLRSHLVTSTILRPNLMYGWPRPGGRDNQVTRVINSLRQNSAIKIVSDTWFSPLSAHFMARVIWHCALQRITGLYNIGGAERMTLLKLSQLTARVFHLNESLIIPTSIHDIPAAPRPIDTSFATDKMSAQFGFPPESVLTGLHQMQRSPVPLTV